VASRSRFGRHVNVVVKRTHDDFTKPIVQEMPDALACFGNDTVIESRRLDQSDA
jgi:hypothetical protein